MLRKSTQVVLLIIVVLSAVLVSGCINGNNIGGNNITSDSYYTNTLTHTSSSTTHAITITSTTPKTTTTTTSNTVVTVKPINNKLVTFYIYGIHTCPHCQAMERRVKKFYGSDHLVFYDLLQKNQTLSEAFKILSGITHSDGVPQVGIFYNNTLKAVILGEFGDDESFRDTVDQYIEVANYYEEQHPNQTAVFMIISRGSLITTNKDLIKKLTIIFKNPSKAVKLYGNETGS